MSHDDPLLLDATDQAMLVRRGTLAAAELVTLTIARIESLNPQLNAVIHQRFEAALLEARRHQAGGEFAGVPFLVKDLMCATAGDPFHCGSRYLQRVGYRAQADSHLARRYRQAGFVILGRTNTPEFGTVCTTEPSVYGPTRNPWNLAYSPGGSSGGSAAAVASGMVAIAHGNDGGGSIRVPAAHCGLFGLKPSRGLISHGPARGEVWAGAAHEHVLTRSVRDSAAVLDLSAGPEAGDPYPNSHRPGSCRAAIACAPRRLRIGMMTTTPGARLALDPECHAAVLAAARVLTGLGHVVEEAYPQALDEADDERHFMRIVASWLAHDLDAAIASSGIALQPGDLEAHTEIVYRMGKALSAVDYLRAQVYLQGWARRVAAWWDTGFDVLLTPVAAAPPPLLGASPATAEDPIGPLRATVPYIAYTAPFNVTGQPAASLPLHWTASGLPVGVQLVAALGQDALLLQLAAELERAAPWTGRLPPALPHAAG